MKLEYDTPINPRNPSTGIETRNAYHLAGRIAAIHLRNTQNNLPSVHFQVLINGSFTPESANANRLSRTPLKYIARLEGGRLIQDLPRCFISAVHLLTDAEKQQCRCAFEADVINLLAGSLAEAKYVAQQDGEAFNANLVYIGALKFYGGALDLETVDEYMNCLCSGNTFDRKKKLAELFLAAYCFVNNGTNWLAISSLAKGLCRCTSTLVSCEDLIAMLENSGSEMIHCALHAQFKQAISTEIYF
jgi:hypothetical protein